MDIQMLASFLLALTVGAGLYFYFRSRRSLQQLIDKKRASDQRTPDSPKP